jgi:hypothetical protein
MSAAKGTAPKSSARTLESTRTLDDTVVAAGKELVDERLDGPLLEELAGRLGAERQSGRPEGSVSGPGDGDPLQ